MDNEYAPWTDMQTRVYHDATLVLQAYEVALARVQQYRGTMYYKKVGSHEYLFYLTPNKDKATSLGARDAGTDARLATWQTERDESRAAFEIAAHALEEQRRFCRAARLGRFDKTAARILRRLSMVGAARHFVVVGTHALYAYEAMAGVHFSGSLTATLDFDVLWDARTRIVFAEVDGVATSGLMDVLKHVDRTFTCNTERTFQAINASGFAVEVLRPQQPHLPPNIGDRDDITPMHLPGLDMLMQPGICREVVIDTDNYPLELQVPDPAAYALHKLWVSAQETRRPEKARRDRHQALALAALIKAHLPTYGFDIDRVQNFPEGLLDGLDDLTSSPSSR